MKIVKYYPTSLFFMPPKIIQSPVFKWSSGHIELPFLHLFRRVFGEKGIPHLFQDLY